MGLSAQAKRTRFTELSEATARNIKRLGWQEPFGIEPGRIFPVCAIGLWGDVCWFYLVDTRNFPSPFPAECFDLVDPALPANWLASQGENSRGAIWIAPKEFIAPTFEAYYERLLTDDKDALREYAAMKARLEVS